MKISELIGKLLAVLVKHGDLEVHYETYDSFSYVTVIKDRTQDNKLVVNLSDTPYDDL